MGAESISSGIGVHNERTGASALVRFFMPEGRQAAVNNPMTYNLVTRAYNSMTHTRRPAATRHEFIKSEFVAYRVTFSNVRVTNEEARR